MSMKLRRRDACCWQREPCSTVRAARAEKKYSPGVTDTEIKIGNTMPYSGNASAYGVVGRAQAAYFRMINEPGWRERAQD